MIDLPTEGLKGIAADLREYIGRRLSPPWTSTAAILEYLGLDILDIHVRGDAAGGSAPEWYVQLTFSGCAGMAEVSSELAVHWAERWYSSEQAGIKAKFFKPYGFEPNGRIEPDRSKAIFAPLGTAGYALVSSNPRAEDEEYFESRYFEIDASVLETLGESETSQLLRQLDQNVPPLLPRHGCCCQMCRPDFDAAAIDRVVRFNEVPS